LECRNSSRRDRLYDTEIKTKRKVSRFWQDPMRVLRGSSRFSKTRGRIFDPKTQSRGSLGGARTKRRKGGKVISRVGYKGMGGKTAKRSEYSRDRRGQKGWDEGKTNLRGKRMPSLILRLGKKGVQPFRGGKGQEEK